MLKVLEGVLMLFTAYLGISSAYVLVRYNVKVYTGEYTKYVLESSTYRRELFGGSQRQVSETTEPEAVTYTLADLIVQASKALAWIAGAVWLATRAFG